MLKSKRLLMFALAFMLILPFSLKVFAKEPENEKPKEATTIVKVNDKVTYKDLIVGKEYTLKGVLMDKSTKKPFLVNKKEVTSVQKFTPKSKDGDVDVAFNVDTKELTKDTVLVVFEDLYLGDKLVVSHKNIDDVNQTITLRKPNVQTTATINKEKEAFGLEKITIKDNVNFKGLVVGKEYTVKGVLMDKETGKPLLIDKKQVEATKTFKADKTDGSIELEFVFDATKLEKTKDVVVFEDLYNGTRKVATHTDINDKNQTVTVRKPNITTSATVEGAKEYEITLTK